MRGKRGWAGEVVARWGVGVVRAASDEGDAAVLVAELVRPPVFVLLGVAIVSGR